MREKTASIGRLLVPGGGLLHKQGSIWGKWTVSIAASSPRCNATGVGSFPTFRRSWAVANAAGPAHHSRDAVKAFEDGLRRFDEVMECYLMTGTRDVLIRVVAADLGDFDRFLEDGLMQMPNIRAMRSSFALRTMIRRDALPGV